MPVTTISVIKDPYSKKRQKTIAKKKKRKGQKPKAEAKAEQR